MPLGRVGGSELRQRREALRAQRRQERGRQMRWLISFAQEDLSHVTPTEAETLGREVERFQALHVRGVVLDRPSSGRRGATQRGSRVRLGAVRTQQERLRALFAELWPTATTLPTDKAPGYSLPVLSSQLYFTRVGAGQVAAIAVARWPATFWLAVASLLQEYGARLRRCPATRGTGVCDRLFLPIGRQRLCSTACAQRERSRAWYAAHRAAVQQRRRDAYRRKTPPPEASASCTPPTDE